MSAHGHPLRGLDSTARSQSFEGRFGRLFRGLRPASYGDKSEDTLKNLGNAMTAEFDPAEDGKDDEESGIPALYTYLGQFIDHDLTFDPASSLQRFKDPEALTDYRTPAFDLDNVYGRGPDDQPYLYQKDGLRFLLGNPIAGGGDPGARDLARNTDTPARALIGDPRNDENAIVSQLHGLFLRFHNRVVDDNPGIPFGEAQQQVRFHYQYVVLNDFLPRIVHPSVLVPLQTNHQYDQHKLRFFHWKNDPFMPVEFSVAAYRLGHSMIRPGYRLNDDDSTLVNIFPGLTGFQAVAPNRAIDWGRFIDTSTRVYDGTPAQNKKRLQFAYRIDTSLVSPLGNLPPSIAVNPSVLAQRNLLRSYRLQLPSGQLVARAMGLPPLEDEQILIGKATDAADPAAKSIAAVNPAFKGNCPLWTYVLAEAMHNKVAVKAPVSGTVTIQTPTLGAVGGQIVAEVILGILFGDASSMLRTDPGWHPKSGRKYGLKDFVQYALGHAATRGAGA